VNISVRTLIASNYQIIGILLGALLITISMGVYTNWDAQLEFEAAANVLNRGYPIVTTGLMINQPPLGFYITAPIFHLFGLSYNNGIAVVTFLGLACIVLVYALGTILYSKTTGLIAAALFGIIPWHVYISRIFLIDNQYLFFSLLTLIFGILALRQNSTRWILASGVTFALALMTKLFAVFTLVPLSIIVYNQSKANTFKLTSKKTLLFLAPSILLQAIWYGGIANQNFFGVYFNSDFTHPELVTNPSIAFLPIILVQSAGYFIFLAAFLALLILLVFRKNFVGTIWLDVLCLSTVGFVALIDMMLVLGFTLKVPYISAIKYNYFALPFFCFLAASLFDKLKILFDKLANWRRPIILLIWGLGFGMILASLIESAVFLHKWDGFVSFGVDSVIYYGFYVYSGVSDYFEMFHFAGLATILISLAFPLLLKTLLRFFPWERWFEARKTTIEAKSKMLRKPNNPK
jgi:4-amino-4-deoxy-L-arabinose transferase-like glycosyltransferase